jgi:hypothetical protein
MSIFERLRKQREDKSNRCLERFLLVRRLEPVSRCPAQYPGPGDLLSLIETTGAGDFERDLKFSEMSFSESLIKK